MSFLTAFPSFSIVSLVFVYVLFVDSSSPGVSSLLVIHLSSIFLYYVTMYTGQVFPVVCCQCAQTIDAVSYHAATLWLFRQTGVPRTVWRNNERVAEHTYLPLFSMQLLLLSPSYVRCPLAQWPFYQHTNPPPVHLATLFQPSSDSHESHVFWTCYSVLTMSTGVLFALPFYTAPLVIPMLQ